MELQTQQQKILIIDDENINLEFFDLMLEKLGFSVELARNGKEGLEKVVEFRPNLIILDNIMPKMSGWEVTKTLKSDPEFRNIPIIMLSALDDVKDKVDSFDLGVDDYITKPFNFSEVLARIRVALRNRELFAQISLGESRLHLAESLSAELKTSIAEFLKSIDEFDAAIARTDNEIDRDTFNALLDLIRDKTQVARNRVSALNERIERTDLQWENLKRNEIGLNILENQVCGAGQES
ncbi:MAG: response regulator [Treponema sp.]|jgi:DNA-binding response OmpR family regulator|nr:response regulator [Treponema sp.]